MTGQYFYAIPDHLVEKLTVKRGRSYYLVDHVKEWVEDTIAHAYEVDWHGTQVNEDYLHESVVIEFEIESDMILFKLKWE